MSRVIDIFVLFASLVILFIFSISHADERSNIHPKANQVAVKSIEEVIREHARELMSIPGVVGVGQGLCDGKSCIKIFVAGKTAEMEQKIPSVLDGFPVVIEVTGPIKALPKK